MRSVPSRLQALSKIAQKFASGLGRHDETIHYPALGSIVADKVEVVAANQAHVVIGRFDMHERAEVRVDRIRLRYAPAFSRLRHLSISFGTQKAGFVSHEPAALKLKLRASLSRDRQRTHRRRLVGPGLGSTHPFSFCVGSLSISSSVAGNGDSNVPFGPLGKLFGKLRISFGAPTPGRSCHV